jgi:TolB-like protein
LARANSTSAGDNPRPSGDPPLPDIFLSYSREDQATARRFAEEFAAAGLDVWWDAALRSGDAYDEVLENALRAAKAVVVLWSRTSVVSRYVRAEATVGDRNKTLMPVMIEPCERPLRFHLTQTADLSQWTGDAADAAWQAFLAEVRRFVQGKPGEAPLGDAAYATVAKVSARKPVLAVLAFENLSGDADMAYFSDGLSEEILETVAHGAALSVIGRGSSFQFRGPQKAASRIAAELKATHVLDGSVRRSGGRLRIVAHLIECASETTLWSSRFEGDLTDVFALQDEIATAVANALKAAFSPSTLQAPIEAETYEIYALFTDLEGFGELARDREPERVANLLNAYLDLLSRAVLEHGGAIDKFIGDAMTAFWGAPLARPDDGDRAARAAIAIWRAGEGFRSTAVENHPPIGRTRVGLHRGLALIGNFGGEGRTNYSALGDSMNTASGLESANKALNTRILVSREALAPSMAGEFRAMGRIGLRGRSTPVEVFEGALDFPPEARHRLNAAYARFDAGEVSALDEIAALAAEFRDDVALEGLVERLRAVGPGGVFHLT